MRVIFRNSKLRTLFVVVACVLAALLVREALGPILEERALYMFFLIGCLAAAWYSGALAGILVLLVGGALSQAVFVQQHGPWYPVSLKEWVFLGIYSTASAIGILIVVSLRRALFRAEQANLLAQRRAEQLRLGMRERTEAEARWRELAAVVESAQDAIITTNLNLDIKTCNAAAERLLGRKATTMLGQSLLELIPESQQQPARDKLAKLRRGEPVALVQTSPLGNSEKALELSISLSPLRNQAGDITGVSGIIRDLGPVRRAERALQASEQRFRTQNEQLAASRQALESERSRYRELFDSAPVGYIISNRQGVIEQANLAAARLLNESPQFLTGFPMARLLAKEDRVTFFAHIGRLTRQEVEKVESWEVVLQPHLRVPFPCAITVNLVRDETGKPAGLRWLMRDISERKQAEQKVLRLNTELEQRVRDRTAELQKANQELEAFSYSVSHDLRAPLRSIAGFSKAVLEEYRDKLDAQGVTYLQYAFDASKRMGHLIEDLLAFSRYTRCEMRRQDVDLSALAESVVNDLRRSEPKRDVTVRVAPGMSIRGDESLLRIALQNLLDNAWKFTGKKPHPEIEFGLAEKNGSSTYFVKDNGAGFNVEHAQRLFGVFQRLHSTEEFPGTGVGLATVRRIFHRHGGEIWAESEVGKGATFFFTLPDEPQ